MGDAAAPLEPAKPGKSRAARHPRALDARPGLRAAAIAIAILVAEVACFRARFTTDHLIGSGLAWAEAIRFSRHAIPFLACVVVGIAMLAARPLRILLARTGRRLVVVHPRWRSAIAHAIALSAFFATSLVVLGRDIATVPASGAWAVAWLAAGIAVLLTAVDWIWPVGHVLATVWRVRGRIAAGVALGVIAYVAGGAILDRMPFWEPVGRATLMLTDGFLAVVLDAHHRLVDVPPNHIQTFADDGTRRFFVHVTRFCSGYEGIVLFLAFFSSFLVAARRRLRFPAVLWLLPLGSLAVWLLNGLRIAILVLIGHFGSADAAIEGFHVYAGWPFLALAALLCVGLATRSSHFSRTRAAPQTPVTTGASGSPAPYIAPLVVATALLMIARAAWLSETLVRLAQVAGVGVLLIAFRSTYRTVLRDVSGCAFAFGIVGALAWALMDSAEPSSSRWLGLIAGMDEAGGTVRVATTVVGYLAVAPLVEELAFRGYLLRRFVSARFDSVDPRNLTALPMTLSSILFGALHDSWLAGTACGVVYALAYARRGRLADAVVAHSVTNLSLLLAASATGQWHWAG